ncbi:MAG: NADH-quinone oxidoreductase subunit C [Anaerolineae bacterium]
MSMPRCEKLPDRVLSALQAAFPDCEIEMEAMPVDDTRITVPFQVLIPAVSLLVEDFGARHLTTITADKTDETLVLMYHFWEGEGLTLRSRLCPSERRVPTLVGLVPGANFYEREVSEMYGVEFEGHPDPAPLLLPEDLEGPPPMLADTREEEGSTHE